MLGKPGLTKKYLEQLDNQNGEAKKEDMETQSVISTLSTISIRPKDETPEQRKERKQLVKEYRRVGFILILYLISCQYSIKFGSLLCSWKLTLFIKFLIILVGKANGEESQHISVQGRKEIPRKANYQQSCKRPNLETLVNPKCTLNCL